MGLIDVPGTHVSLVPPDGFSASSYFPGFELTEKNASILISEIPTAVDSMIAGMTDEGLRGEGVIVVGREELSVDGWRAMLIDGTQTAFGVTFYKWMLVMGGETLTALIVAAYPTDAPDLRIPLRTSLEGVVFEPDRPTDPLAALPFTLDPAPPLRFAGTFSNNAVYNTSGNLPGDDHLEPSLLVGPSIGPIVGSRESFLSRRMTLIPNKTDIQLGAESAITVGPLEGFEVTGTGTDTSTGEKVAIYGAVLFRDDERYVLAIGFCREADGERFIEVFRTSTNSFRMKVG